MSNTFREFVKKIGSGTHTGKNLTRAEAEQAMTLILEQEATPAQIGAFLIAHRIKRPSGEELAGMLDGYSKLGPKLEINHNVDPLNSPSINVLYPIVMGCPYDGRSRTAPVTPITALILATAGLSVILHGGDRMPTKEGLPLIEIWQSLGIDWTKFSIAQVQSIFNKTGLGFIHLATHFPTTNNLVNYRREIGKRPPIATMELMWSPFSSNFQIVSGYVHPPTEIMFLDAFKLRNIPHYTTVKGLEGSCDLPRDRTAIIGFSDHGSESLVEHNLIPSHPTQETTAEVISYPNFQRLLLHPWDYGLQGKEVPLNSASELIEQTKAVLNGEKNELMSAAIWNGGFYLWRFGLAADIVSGLAKAEKFLISGLVKQKLAEISHGIS